MNHSQRTLMLDAAQFIAGAIADGYGNRRQAHRLALALSAEGGEGPQMERVLTALDEKQRAELAHRKGNE